MRSLRIHGTDELAHCNRITCNGYTDERGRIVTSLWVDDRKAYTLGRDERGPVFVPARGYAA